ncbi:MAG: mechanosensitive ion channel family protein [Erysipelotrichaceae bacterium]|nr:mechanosensitive ion channel family protein [Erysipelotrichaceae bacterium]
MNDSIFTNGLNYFLISSTVTVLFALVIDRICKRLTDRFNKKYEDKITTNQYLYQTIRALVWMVAIIVIIRQIKPLSSLGDTILGATSIIAVAVGIAAQATFGNYIAGFFLAVHQPFKVGDIISIKEKDLSGTVQEITFRHTVLLTQEQTEIIIPNTVMNSAIIEDMSNGNYSKAIELKVAGDTDLKKLQKIIKELLDQEELVNHEKESLLVVKGLTVEGYQLSFPVYTDSLNDFSEVRNHLLPKLSNALAKNKIKIV